MADESCYKYITIQAGSTRGSGRLIVQETPPPPPKKKMISKTIAKVVLIHPRQGEGLKVLRCYEEHMAISVACGGDTRDVNRRPKTKNEGLHHTI